MKRDCLHFNWCKQLGHQKTWNYCISERESGKTVDSWMLLRHAFKRAQRPSIVLRRRIADITSAYIDDISNVLNKFLDEPIQLLYMKGDMKQGIVDIKVAPAKASLNYNQIKQLPVFVRMIALSVPMSRIKSLMLKNVKYIFQDEFIVNLAAGEKYLTNEMFLIKEIYTTYNREAETSIVFLGAANPYSVYCPHFTDCGVDTRLLKPGAFITGDNYTINCFQIPTELKEKILKDNPLYQFDNAYARYAFDGEAVNDANIRLHKTEPKGFKLKFILKFGNDFLSIHQGTADTFKYWCCKHRADWLQKIGKRRDILVLNFQDMIDGSRKLSREDGMALFSVKKAMDERKITFNCIDAHYMLEDLYNVI